MDKDSFIEYQVIVKIYLASGASIRQVVRSSDRKAAISKYNYLDDLVKKQKIGENREWVWDQFHVQGEITGLEGMFGVSYVKVL
jgi:hypothetical protein